jgi:hypothetical protein
VVVLVAEILQTNNHVELSVLDRVALMVTLRRQLRIRKTSHFAKAGTRSKHTTKA